MNLIIDISIDIIEKSGKIYTTKNGEKRIVIELFQKKIEDKFGNTYGVKLPQTKQERENKIVTYVGNGKEIIFNKSDF